MSTLNRVSRSPVTVVCALSAAMLLLTLWALGRVDPHYYYATAVRSMSLSWHNFVYGSLDPAGAISVDKVPGGLWVPALFVRVLGFHPWVLLLPQALAAAATVPVLYDTVRRWTGRTAGVAAALVFTLTPITVVLARIDVPDTIMVLLLVCAANAISRVTTVDSWRPVLLAGLWVGLAFQVKMLQALIILPVLVAAYLLAASGPLRRALTRVAALVGVTLAVSASWLVLVSLTPAANRPFVDGSTHNSAWEMALRYNGLDRIAHGDAAGAQVQSFLTDFGGPPGPGRLFGAEVGGQIGWLIPFALIALVAGLALRGRDERAGWVLWGGWLVGYGLAFTTATGIHPYYTATLAPAIAALTGAGLVTLFDRKPVLVGGIAVTGATAVLFALRYDSPGWLAPACGLVAVAACAALLLPRLPLRATASLAIAALVLAPAVWTVAASGKPFTGLAAINPTAGPADPMPATGLAVMHGLPPDTPFPPGMGDMHMITPNHGLLHYVREHHGAERFALAVPSVNTAVPYLGAGLSVLPMGGFTGAAPEPSLRGLGELVDGGQLRYVMTGGFHAMMGGPVSAERQAWVAGHCALVRPEEYHEPPGPPGMAESLYDCGHGAR